MTVLLVLTVRDVQALLEYTDPSSPVSVRAQIHVGYNIKYHYVATHVIHLHEFALAGLYLCICAHNIPPTLYESSFYDI